LDFGGFHKKKVVRSATETVNINSLHEIILKALENQQHQTKQDEKKYLRIDDIPYEEDKDFVGRKKELEEIIKNIKNRKTLHIKSFIFGLGGVGKTALATQAVYEIKKQNLFPDGIIWYRVRDTDIEKVIYRLSNIICRAAKIENDIISLTTLEEKVETFKSSFKRYKLLFVLDNADYHLDKIIRPLLDLLSGFSVILTSRQEITLSSSSHIINLGGLSTFEALSLFKRIIGEESFIEYGKEIEIKNICDLVGNLPLAVKLAAMYCIEKRCSFKRYIELWTKERKRLSLLSANTTDIEESRRNISSCFELSLNEINETEKELFLTMTLFQSNFDINALSNIVSERFFSNAENKLDFLYSKLNKLKKYSLIDRFEGIESETRIFLHPLIIEFGSEKRTGVIDEKVLAINNYYLDNLKSNPISAKHDYVNILKAIEWKFNLAEHNGFIEYTKGVIYSLHTWGLWKLKRQILDFAYKSALLIDSEEDIAFFLGTIGDIKVRQHDNTGYSDVQKAIQIYEKLGIDYVSKNDSLSNHYIFFKYLITREDNIDYLTSLKRAVDGLSIANQYTIRKETYHFIDTFGKIYSYIGFFSEARRLTRISHKIDYNHIHNWSLALINWVDNIPEHHYYTEYLKKITEKIIQRAEKHNAFDALIICGIPNHILHLLLENEFSKALVILEAYKGYFETTDNEKILVTYFTYYSLYHEKQHNYIEALKYLQKSHNIENNYFIKIAYLSILLDDRKTALYNLKHAENQWSNYSVINRFLYYSVRLFFSIEYDYSNINKYFSIYQTYLKKTNYTRIEIEYPEIVNRIKDLKCVPDNNFSKLLDKKNETELSIKMQIFREPNFRIVLPKTFNIFPITVGDLIEYCKLNNLELPLYYKIYGYTNKLNEPARFINANLANAIVREMSCTFPKFDDLGIIQSISNSVIGRDYITTFDLKNEIDWNTVINKVLQWCGLKQDEHKIIQYILLAVNLTLEDRFRLLQKIKLEGIEMFPRLVYYKIQANQLNLEFAKKNKVYLINQWRMIQSLLVLLGEIKLPKFTACWSVYDLSQTEIVSGLMPLAAHKDFEPSHAELSYSDVIVFRTKIIDDYLMQDKGLF
jgi:NB-ARC domain